MPLVRVLRNGQITMPKGFRKILGIKAGDVLEATLGGFRRGFRHGRVAQEIH